MPGVARLALALVGQQDDRPACPHVGVEDGFQFLPPLFVAADAETGFSCRVDQDDVGVEPVHLCMKDGSVFRLLQVQIGLREELQPALLLPLDQRGWIQSHPEG